MYGMAVNIVLYNVHVYACIVAFFVTVHFKTLCPFQVCGNSGDPAPDSTSTEVTCGSTLTGLFLTAQQTGVQKGFDIREIDVVSWIWDIHVLWQLHEGYNQIGVVCDLNWVSVQHKIESKAMRALQSWSRSFHQRLRAEFWHDSNFSRTFEESQTRNSPLCVCSPIFPGKVGRLSCPIFPTDYSHHTGITFLVGRFRRFFYNVISIFQTDNFSVKFSLEIATHCKVTFYSPILSLYYNLAICHIKTHFMKLRQPLLKIWN